MTDLRERVAATGLLSAGAPVVVMLSGGRDSVCLLDVAVALGARVRALHVVYGLRDASAEDAALCERLCAALGVELAVRRPRRPEPRGNLQAWARDVRYAEAATLARGAAVAAGHTASDQAETILYPPAAPPRPPALAGRPGRPGAHGLRPGRDDPLPAGRLARPPGAAGDAGALGAPRPPAAGRRGHARGDGRVVSRARAALVRGREQRGRPLRPRARARRPGARA